MPATRSLSLGRPWTTARAAAGLTAATLLAAVPALVAAPAQAAPPQDDPALRAYQVTVTNLTAGQPLSPPLAVTHRASQHLYAVGAPSSEGLDAIAQGGDTSVLAGALAGVAGIRDAVEVGAPITPTGTMHGTFSDSVTFTITGRQGDRLSLASMLICTNDGFAGLDGLRLPPAGTTTAYLDAYDAGSEANTEANEDIVPPCGALGPVPLIGGGGSVAEDEVVRHHPGIDGTVGVLTSDHAWTDPVAMVSVTRVA